MSSFNGPGSVTNGLVFAYDMSNPGESFIGAPTTNLAAFPATGYNWINSGSAVYTDDDTIEPLPDLPNNRYFTTPLKVVSCRSTADGSQHCGYGFTTVSPSTVYTMSCWFKQNVAGLGPYLRTSVNNNSLGNFAYNGNTDSSTWPVSNWIRISATGTTQSNENGIYLSNYLGINRTKVCYVGGQVEQKSFASPLAQGSRSTSQALLDLKNTSTVTASSLTYSSNNTFSFNGSSDYIDLGGDKVFKTTGGHTVENWFKLDAVVSGNLYNFIGASSIDYHSWYWCVFQSKLAIWNVSPGYWYYGSTTIQPNTWYQAVMVTNDAGTGIQFYLNGVAEGGTHASYSFNSSYSGLKIGYIGRGDASNARYFYGSMPVTRVYDRALSASEVQQNFQALRGRYGI